MGSAATVIRLEAAQAALRDQFLGWQCRIRQMAVRQNGGRPMEGMRPTLSVAGAPDSEITTVLVKRDAAPFAAQFRHMAQRTHDPAQHMLAALELLAAGYYQRPVEFSEELTALFGPGLPLVDRLSAQGRCRLEFEQYGQRYRLPCAVRRLAETEPAWQATYWHNTLFNPAIPGGIAILGFAPDWAHGEAEPEST